jgi:hypothetical protein
MTTEEKALNLLSKNHAKSLIESKKRLDQDDARRNFNGIYLGQNKVDVEGDIRIAYNQGTKEVLIGESVVVTFPAGSQIGSFTSKIS